VYKYINQANVNGSKYGPWYLNITIGKETKSDLQAG